MTQKQIYPLYFILPALAIYLSLFILPGVVGILYSFTDWNRYSDEVHFIGLENFREIFTSSRNYTKYLMNTLRFTVISNIVKIIPALILAIFLNEGVRGKNFYRAILFFPSVLSFMVIGLVFRSILHPTTGLLNQFFRGAGWNFLAQKWLVDIRFVWASVYAVDAWHGIGYVMTIFIAGLQAIPRVYYEAADIDGAGQFLKTRHITLPMIIPAITINLIFGITYGLKVFEIIYVLTGGGPGRFTEVLNTAVFKEFADGFYGIGTALSTILFAVMAFLGYFIIKFMNKKAVDA